MFIVIAGVGAVGMYLAKMLVDNKHNVTIIDKDIERLRIAESQIDLLTINGSSSLISVLEQANVGDADLLIAVTSDHDVNFITCILGKKLGAKMTIARIRDYEYLYPEEQAVYKSIGVDNMIYPERIAALEIAELLKVTAAAEAFSFSNDKLTLLFLKVDNSAAIIGKTLTEISMNEPTLDFRAVAIKRGNHTIIPTGKERICENDQIYIITKREKINRIFELSGNVFTNIKDIMIIGGSKVGKRTALELEGHFNIKLIERDKTICNELSALLEKTLIINADGHDLKVLEEEGIKRMDAFISVTNNTEVNIFLCLLAKKYGIKKTIALVDDLELIEVSQNIGIDTIINKKLIAASYIYRYTLDAEVVVAKSLVGVEADVFEFIVQEDSRVANKILKDLKFPEGAIIGGLVRKKKSEIATGNTVIIPGDHVIVFSEPKVVPEIQKFFQ